MNVNDQAAESTLLLSNSARALQDILRAKIQQDGFMSVADFMALILGHLQHGYYMRQDPFGQRGDFTTAPEISQLFGEMIGIWLADYWQRMGAPPRVILCEIGAGRGSLMRDILRVAAGVAGLSAALEVHIVETSPVLRAVQSDTLKGGNIGSLGGSSAVQWHEDFAAVPDHEPLFVVANELLDALPVQQYCYQGGGWHERGIVLSPQGTTNDKTRDNEHDGEHLGKRVFDWGLRPSPDFAAPLGFPVPLQGAICEISLAREALVSEIAQRLKRQSGAALMIDYGHEKSDYGDTLQALRQHKIVNVLDGDTLGDADITSHVDFGRLREVVAAQGIDFCALNTQGAFLHNMGIALRAARLLEQGDKNQREDVTKALHRLTHSDEMGALFKVMGMAHGTNEVQPAGF
ncbi:MAG: class I SAM-dependent methyltransferase [Alphaproteobacteria bacterium]